MIDWASLEVYYSSESVHVVDCRCCSYFGTMSVPSDGCHCDIVIIHEPDYIVGHIF